MSKIKPKYKAGDLVWLAEFDNGENVQPRERAEVLSADVMSWGISYVCQVEPSKGDDGLRELTEDQIEGLQ